MLDIDSEDRVPAELLIQRILDVANNALSRAPFHPGNSDRPCTEEFFQTASKLTAALSNVTTFLVAMNDLQPVMQPVACAAACVPVNALPQLSNLRVSECIVEVPTSSNSS